MAKKRPQAGRARANLLFVAALPLLFTAFGGGAVSTISSLTAFALIVGAAWLTREGLEAQEAYEARTIARRPALPRKIFGSVFVGLGVGLATFDTGLIDGILYGILASALHLISFGIDPLRNKTATGTDAYQTDRVARAVDEAEKHLRAMSDAIEQTRDRVMIARVEKFQTAARAMFRRVENDPRELSAARRYLSVYLLGARDATFKLADLQSHGRDPAASKAYLALLDDLEANFTAKTRAFLEDNRTDLDIEIDVLRDRLRREGVRVK